MATHTAAPAKDKPYKQHEPLEERVSAGYTRQSMSSPYNAGPPYAGTSWGSHRDGDQAPVASFPHDHMTAIVSKATKVAVGSGHDERSVPVPSPLSGIERARGDEGRRSLPAGKQAWRMSGNTEQPDDRANGNFTRQSSGMCSDDSEDSQAISAAALLLLAASATSQTKLPIGFGAASRGTSVHENVFRRVKMVTARIKCEEVIRIPFFVCPSGSLAAWLPGCLATCLSVRPSVQKRCAPQQANVMV